LLRIIIDSLSPINGTYYGLFANFYLDWREEGKKLPK
jgi:hypothetical protein